MASHWTGRERDRMTTNAAPATRNAQVIGRHAHRSGLVGRSALSNCGPHSGFSWSHLWSHSCRFRGVRSGLPSLGSGGTGPNRTGLNHQPQNSKAREGQPSAGSNPAATASLTRPNAGRAATWAPAFWLWSQLFLIGASLVDHRRPSRRLARSL